MRARSASWKAELGLNRQVGIGLLVQKREGCAHHGQSKQRQSTLQGADRKGVGLPAKEGKLE